ncbi:MAG: FtsW/RodA/SpoVE family cell cycle protein [Candidatus Eisenbacteria sp.]|nr:FtsW/RodA/SpoVE family cell cycle protein [Candidatus Eisenbacteria bacterium]
MGLWRRSGARAGWIAAAPGRPDRILLGAVLVLLAWGLLMVYSSSSALGIVSHRGNDLFYLQSQLARAALGLVILLGLACLDIRYLSQRVAWTVWAVALIVIGVLVIPSGPGVEVHGATRWLPIGSSLVQPAEFARVALMICLAGLLSGSRERLGTWRGMLPPVGVVLLTAGLIAIQPHLSLALLTAASGLLLVFLAGGSLWRLGVISGGGLALTSLVMRGYHQGRLASFMEMVQEFLGRGGSDPAYQVKQSIIGVGSGGLAGLGLGKGMQKNFFLPDAHTDFILSIITEELGLLGLVGLLLLTGIIVARIFLIGRRATSSFAGLLAYGIGIQVILASLLHAAVCLGWAPTTGVPYPLVSFGGSALVANLTGLGLVLAVSRRGTPFGREGAYGGPLLMNEPQFGRTSR